MKLHTICTPKTSRFRFVRDDSCHWYSIPSEESDNFDKWCLSFEDEAEEYDGKSFNEYRLSGSPSNYTFENLQEDK
jgi:hypothetical protein